MDTDRYDSFSGKACRVGASGCPRCFCADSAGGAKSGKKEAPKPKKRPPALPEDKKKLQEEWPLLRNEVEDVILKSQLKQVEIAFKEDDLVYLVCAYAALTDMLQKNMDKIEFLLDKAMGKSFSLQTITKEEYDRWYEVAYGKAENKAEDAEFESLLGSYFPEVDFEE
ncbi:hypothetical protein SDC9_179659 [bioreactor metagenome]|uniref:Uncharacterized protein n=1 Tax=bioreactor metagenome TaxID=1076179 RepID=A0A645H8S7_9ZZZZ